ASTRGRGIAPAGPPELFGRRLRGGAPTRLGNLAEIGDLLQAARLQVRLEPRAIRIDLGEIPPQLPDVFGGSRSRRLIRLVQLRRGLCERLLESRQLRLDLVAATPAGIHHPSDRPKLPPHFPTAQPPPPPPPPLPPPPPP